MNNISYTAALQPMESRFQPFDLSTECRIYFRFLTENSRIFSAYYNRPNFCCDAVLKEEALANAEKIRKLFHLKELVQIRIVRTQRQMQLAEHEIQPIP